MGKNSLLIGIFEWLLLVHNISRSQKISVNAKYLNNKTTKENFMEIEQILFQEHRECTFFANVWNCPTVYNVQYTKPQ